MEEKEFKNILLNGLKKNNIELGLDDRKIDLLFNYMNFIIEKNKNINLTAITDKVEFIYKHYIDSLYLSKFIGKGSLLDIGTGAGFPGIPLLISIDELKVDFLDSRNKKLLVIKEFIKNNNIKGAEFLHERAELLHKDKKFNKRYNFITTRAVSNIKNVINYSMPYLRNEGISIAMRGPLNEEEQDLINNNIYIKEVFEYSITDSENTEHKRTVLVLKNEDKNRG